MSYKDMQRERIAVGKAVVKDYLNVVGKRTVASLKNRYDLDKYYSITRRDQSSFKTNIRLQRARNAKRK